MKLFLTVLAVVSLNAADPALNGKWQIHQTIGGSESDVVCTFTQSGGDLSGSCDVRGATAQITGKVEGDKVAWSFKSEYNGSPLTVTYKGTVDASKLTGTVTVPEYSVDGPFTATQAK